MIQKCGSSYWMVEKWIVSPELTHTPGQPRSKPSRVQVSRGWQAGYRGWSLQHPHGDSHREVVTGPGWYCMVCLFGDTVGLDAIICLQRPALPESYARAG